MKMKKKNETEAFIFTITVKKIDVKITAKNYATVITAQCKITC